MNAAIALCHFCELHGPKVLFTTQAFHETDVHPHLGNQTSCASQRKSCYGNIENLRSRGSHSEASSCEACQSLDSKELGFISNDHAGRISYLSTQEATQRDVARLMRHACFRSLSCEVSSGREAPSYFGDNCRGHVISHTFFLKDSKARGFNRWFSFIILMRDKLFLLNSWPFFVEHMKSLIEELQRKASRLYDEEHAKFPWLRACRLSPESSPFKEIANKPARPLPDLTADKYIYAKLHWWFTWLLMAGAERLVERMSEGLPGHVREVNWDKYHYEVADTEEGFTLVLASEKPSPVLELEANGEVERLSQPTVKTMRHLRHLLGHQQFRTLAFCFMTGHQIVVRGQPHELVSSVIRCLKILVPSSCYKAILHSDEYVDILHCNILGLDPWAAAPKPSRAVARLDILTPLEKSSMLDIQKYIYKVSWGGTLPSKYPTVFVKMEKALDNDKLADSVLQYYFVAMKEEWLNNSKIIRRIQRNSGPVQDTSNLLHALGAQGHDKVLLDFWGSGVP